MSRPKRHSVALLAVLAAAIAAIAAPAGAGAKRFVVETTQPPSEQTGEAPSTGETPAPSPRSERRALRRDAACTLTLQAGGTEAVTSGEAVALTGALSCAQAADAEGRPVTIFQRERGSRMHEVSTVTTGPGGAFALNPVLSANSAFVARFGRVRSPLVKVDVATAVTLAGPAAAGAALLTRGGVRRAGQINRFTFTGTVAPAVAGARVTLQRRYSPGEPWHRLKYARTDEEGRFSFTRAFRRSGILSLRAVVHMRGHIPSYSPVLTYVLEQAQNPALTIDTPTDPLPAGQPTTVTGVLAAGAGHTVVLLAKTPGTHFAPLASTQTGEGGTYSFDVAPASDTTYRVRSGHESSTSLFLGVMPLIALDAPPASAQVGVPVTIAGTLTGAAAGASVLLEREVPGGRFLTVSSTLAQPDGSFSFSPAFMLAGTDTLRVATPASAVTTGAVSEPFTLTVSAGAPEP